MIQPPSDHPATGEAGMVDRDEACRRFGVSRHVWKDWVRKGFVDGGRCVGMPGGGRRKMYTAAELDRLRERLATADTVRRDPLRPGRFLIPDGFVDRAGACRMFGVSKTKWDRWTWTGRITCGEQPLKNGPTLYPIAELERLVAELGRLAPPYPDPQRPGCYRVPVHGWALKRKEVIIDADALPLIAGGRLQCPGLAGARKPSDLAYVIFYTSDGTRDLLHRMILGMTDPDLVVAHLNGDPLDCRRANLFVRTKAARIQAARKIQTKNGRPTSSRYKGVSWEESRGIWVARIHVEGRTHRLGRFKDEIAAAEAYDEAARKFFGEHAYQNFPRGIDAALEFADPPDQPARAA